MASLDLRKRPGEYMDTDYTKILEPKFANESSEARVSMSAETCVYIINSRAGICSVDQSISTKAGDFFLVVILPLFHRILAMIEQFDSPPSWRRHRDPTCSGPECFDRGSFAAPLSLRDSSGQRTNQLNTKSSSYLQSSTSTSGNQAGSSFVSRNR